jgi:ketosteroid isomerase-like protein
MAAHPDAEMVRNAMEALDRQDIESFGDAIDDDVVWHMIGTPEPLRGKSALAQGFGSESRDYTITAELHDVTASDDHVIALVKAHATRGDQTLDYDTAEIFHLRDGKITERWAFSDDTARIAEFFA